MHYYCLVLIPNDGDPEAHVRRLLEPYSEHIDDNEKSFWDWWVIGGRWAGHLDGYDPNADQKNWEWCEFCQRTGIRTDLGPAKPCNACTHPPNDKLPTGKRVKWPTDRAAHHGDVQGCPLELKDDQIPFTLVREDGSVEMKERLAGGEIGFQKTEGFDESARSAVREHTGRVVVVDYHC